ncbi:hypothetical protein GCM10011514_13910 [Emticicia aquatilis]|uniref:Transglutaminase-like domain-containing protein n=1 Tax=Emticicia aquatilis TaxID=1537369 RepID=A0A917DNG2_9BACT|nr:transglutaminase domain-containing protein [Emticicia aquatilis]GGD50901.1 hypothetical protein GCM10011514_13910 [Emticicia aquatilis]
MRGKIYLTFCLLLVCSRVSFAQHYSIFPKFDDTPKVKELAKSITDTISKDSIKVLAIHKWIINNIDYDDELLEKEKNGRGFNIRKPDVFTWKNGLKDPTQVCSAVLKNEKALCRGYAFLFVALCSHSGIYADVVVGNVKDSTISKDETGHAWNIFQINKKWYLCDPTWDASLIKNPSPFEELKSPFENLPEEFLKSRCSIDPATQLVDNPQTLDVFFGKAVATNTAKLNFNEILNAEKGLKDEEKLFRKSTRMYNFNPNEYLGVCSLLYYYGSKIDSYIYQYFSNNKYINSSKTIDEMTNKALPLKKEMLRLAEQIKSNFNKVLPLIDKIKDTQYGVGINKNLIVKSMQQFYDEEKSLKSMYVQLETHRKNHPHPTK